MWPFEQPENVAAFVSRHILEGDLIYNAYRSWEDGSWSFLPDRITEDGDCRIVCLKSIYDRDSSIGELADLQEGWKATREQPGGTWLREKDHPYSEFSEQGYHLIQVALFSSVYPEAPPLEKRENLKAGDFVKLLFRFAAEDAPFQPNDTERMWVRISQVDEDNFRYFGTVDNAPVHEAVISCGHQLWFHESHIYAIDGANTES